MKKQYMALYTIFTAVVVSAAFYVCAAVASTTLAKPAESESDSAGAAESAESAVERLAVAPVWEPLLGRLVADGFDEDRLRDLFGNSDVRFDPTVLGQKAMTLYRSKFGSEEVRRIQRRLEELGYTPGPADGVCGVKTRAAIRSYQAACELPVDGRPSEELRQRLEQEEERKPAGLGEPPKGKARRIYRILDDPERLAEAKQFYEKHKDLLLEIEQRYGLPSETAVGVLTVETRLGTFLGEEPAMVNLASMAAGRNFTLIEDYFELEKPTGKRFDWLKNKARVKADWAYEELKALLEYTEMNGMDTGSVPGSCYGAIGICQFMPTNALRFGVDGDGDGRVDLFVLEDAVYSIGNFLRDACRLTNPQSRKNLRRALYRYNRSRMYVNSVMYVADKLADKAG